MKSRAEFQAEVGTYDGVLYIYDERVGCVAWRAGVGGSIEFLVFETVDQDAGQYIELLRQMVRAIETAGDGPHPSVYMIRRDDSVTCDLAHGFGWFQQTIDDELNSSIYDAGVSVLLWTRWDKLKRWVGA